MVVPDFFYGVLVIDSKDPNFNANSCLKVHNMVSILLFSYNLWDWHMKNCARIKNQSGGRLPLMSKLTYYHMFILVLFGT